jgi:hypothetical protein
MLELDVDVVSRGEDVLVLELVEFETGGELVFPLNWVTTTKEERATMMTRTTKVELFLVRLVMTCLSSCTAHDLATHSQ